MYELVNMRPRTARIRLPCNECTQPCCRVANHGWPHSTAAHPYNEHGRCPMLADAGQCRIYGKHPANCQHWRCDTDKVFRARHPDVDALLKAKGL